MDQQIDMEQQPEKTDMVECPYKKRKLDSIVSGSIVIEGLDPACSSNFNEIYFEPAPLLSDQKTDALKEFDVLDEVQGDSENEEGQ